MHCRDTTGRAKAVRVDIAPGGGVDLVADAYSPRVVDRGTLDLLLTVSVLEKLGYPLNVVAAIFRILEPSGIVYVGLPFASPFPAAPDDFLRFSYR